MAVTVTEEQAVAGIYAQPSIETNARVRVILEAAIVMVEAYAPSAPEAIQNQATIRLVGYMHDSPLAPEYRSHSNPMAFSGAASLLSPYRVRRAGAI